MACNLIYSTVQKNKQMILLPEGGGGGVPAGNDLDLSFLLPASRISGELL